VLRLGDDALVLAQRLTYWCSHAPQFEEDIAVANIALDLLGQARLLLTYAGGLGGGLRDEDALAFEREATEFTNLLLVEQENGDFGHTIVRQLLFSSYQLELYTALSHSIDTTLGEIAEKAAKEVAYHRDHAAEWTVRLGDGTQESRVRAQAALRTLWQYVDEMFEQDPLAAMLHASGVAADHAALRAPWQRFVRSVIDEATLEFPTGTTMLSGGRRGEHSESFSELLAEMKSVRIAHAGAIW
jgi:ring-1,2-phenylacetyl-CoA epoxidase subunit PaaC